MSGKPEMDAVEIIDKAWPEGCPEAVPCKDFRAEADRRFDRERQMPDYDYETLGIWTRQFDLDQQQDAEAKDRLRNAYRLFWQNAITLASQISKDLPQLTLHDEKHFSALWRAANLLVGDRYLLNPLELFVFGGSILLHDLGHAVATFPGGLSELKSTNEWKDALAAARDQAEDRCSADGDSGCTVDESKALFVTLRALHASRAEKLAEIKFSRTDNGENLYLIEDSGLRGHLGEIMGLIAASHHWDLNKVASELSGVMGPPAPLPQSWGVNQIRIACLLRCADAIQIDQSRAPDFLYAMLKLQGLSESHWRAQNRLTSPVLDPDDPKSIVFSSSKAFEERDALAWWLAFDAIRVANSELIAADRLMRDLRMDGFAVTGVKDAQSEARLSKHVRTRGWRPIRAQPFVAAAERIITMFGGQQLYGRDKSVAVRELIQNAADAVKARRENGQDNRYDGCIDIVVSQEEDGSYLFSIDDDGIGMSEAVLIGPLLEFGKSYWKSDLLRQERPGLASRLRRQSGEYGIGFYSVFMASRKVEVCSRAFDASVRDFRTLSFASGYEQRPILLDKALENMPSSVSTRVTLRVSKEDFAEITEIRLRGTSKRGVTSASMSQLVAHLCPCVDVDIFVTESKSQRQLVHRSKWYESERLAWLRQITLAELQGRQELENLLAKAASRLQPVLDISGNVIGLAAINTDTVEAGVSSVGGFVDGHGARYPEGLSVLWVGALPFASEGPRRNSLRFAVPAENVKEWAAKSAADLVAAANAPRSNYLSSIFIAEFDANPADLAAILVNDTFVSLDEIVENIYSNDMTYAICVEIHPDGKEMNIGSISFRVSGSYHLGLSRSELAYDCMTIQALGVFGLTNPRYASVLLCSEDPNNSFLGCLQQKCKRRGFEIDISLQKDYPQARYIGPGSEREGLRKDTILRGNCLVLRAKRRS